MSLRLELVTLASAGGVPVAELCRRLGVSRKTAYKWISRHREGGEVALADRSRRPREMRQPTPAEVEAVVLAVREAHPAWGGRKIKRRLEDMGHADVPAASTITKLLHRHGLINAEASAAATSWQRFERSAPNELWQLDFKGEVRTDDGRWCYPLTMSDDCTRYNLLLSACLDQVTATVRDRLTATFERYGQPEAMLMDNGTPWSNGRRAGGWSKLTVWLVRHDIGVIHGRPYHPQTQGKEERFHRTLKAELIQGRRYRDAPDMQDDFDRWRPIFNRQRPHEALDMDTPASRYTPSRRAFQDTPSPIEYDTGDHVRKVNAVGQISFGGTAYKLSQAFAGQPVALRPTTEDGVWRVYYCRQRIGQIDARSRQVTVRYASGRCAPSGVADETDTDD